MRAVATNLQAVRAIALLLLSACLVGFAVCWQRSGHVHAGSRSLPRSEFGNARMLKAITELGQMGVTIDPERGDSRGMLRVGRPEQDRSVDLPSTRLLYEACGTEPAFDVLSVAMDPRDWRGPDGIYDNPQRRGRNWTREASVSLHRDGELAHESPAGVCIHGGTSRKKPEKSLRLLLTAEFGATVTSDDLLPGALGDSLVVHNDQRRQRFCNPISYEMMARLGCTVPKTRPVRVVVNGELQKRVFFLTEHLSDSHIEARLGHRNFVRLSEQGGHHRLYDKTVWRVHKEYDSMEQVAREVDLDDIVTWLAGVLFAAPFDCRQGIAYYELHEQKWYWLVWDLDWSFGQWPEIVSGQPLKQRNIVDFLLHSWGDVRTVLFDRFMREDSEFRTLLLARLSRVLNHELTVAWCDEVVARYRGIAARYAAGSRAARADLDAIHAFMLARPERLRAELSQELGIEGAHRCLVQVPSGASVRIDGFDYGSDWTGRYFDGQEVVVEVPAGCTLEVDGTAVDGRVWRHAMAADHVVRVVAK